MNTNGLISFLLLMITGFGCANSVHGSHQQVVITSEPQGARVSADPGGAVVTTPGKLDLHRGTAYLLTYRLEGFQPRSMEVAPESSWWLFGNLLVGGMEGLQKDLASGAAYKLVPDPAHAVLLRSGESPPFPWRLEIAMPRDEREPRQSSALTGLGRECDAASPFGPQTPQFVQQRLRGALLNAGLFENVDAGSETGRDVLRVEVLAMCSHLRGFIVLRAVGVTSLRIVLEHDGATVLDEMYSSAVSDKDDEYTGPQAGTRDQFRLRTILDSLRVAIDGFLEDARTLSEAPSDELPAHRRDG